MLTGIDLFAGGGGLTLGLKQAGIETLCAVEIDPNSAQTYSLHTPNAEILNVDVRASSVLRHLAKYRGRGALVYGGPPCQPFSSGGQRAAAADIRDMIPWFIEAIRCVQPLAFLMENVPGLAVGDRMGYLGRVVAALIDAGYQVVWRVLNAADYGVPQKRRRLFIVGTRGFEFGFPRPTHGGATGNPHRTVADTLPPYQIGEPNLSRVFYAKTPDLRPSPYDGHLFNGGGRPIDPESPAPTILASAGGNKTHFFDDLGLAVEYHSHLLHGGAPRQGPVEGCRRLTVDESAVLQTFPRDIKFCGPRSSQYQQIGNAVPPALGQQLGEALVAQLGNDGEWRERFSFATQPRLFWGEAP